MARDGMRLLSTRSSKGSLMERSKSKNRKRESGFDQQKSFENDNTKYIIKPDGPQNPPRGSLNITRASTFVLSSSMEFPRPRTSTGPQDISRFEDFAEVMPLRPRTSGGVQPEVAELDFAMFKRKRAQTWAKEPLPTTTGKPRAFSLSQNPLPSGRPSIQIDLPLRSSSRLAMAQPDYIGVAIGSPTHHHHHHPLAASTMTHSPETTHSRDSFIPAHNMSLTVEYADEEKENIAALPQEHASKGWKKLFGRGLFNKKTLTRSHSTGSGQSTPSLSSVEDSPTSAPLLSLNIPTAELDRYSVMFGSLLEPAIVVSAPAKVSLLSRRRSKDLALAGQQKIFEALESSKVKPSLTINSKNSTGTRGNMTLGLVDRSPLWLFPATPRTPRTPGSSTRDRSNTLPSEQPHEALPTPTTPSSRKKRPESDIVPSLVMMLQDNRDERAKRGPLSPFSITSAESELDTPVQGENGDAPWIRQFDISEEPEWEMLTTTALRPRSASPTDDVVDVNTPITPTHGSEELIATAAKVSIARQISVSQRQLLLPIVSNSERFIRRPSEVTTEIIPVSAVSTSCPPLKLTSKRANRESSIFDSAEIQEATQPRKSSSYARPRLVDLTE